MKLKIRTSNTKKSRSGGFRSRQKTKGGRKINARQRRLRAGK
jgi:ribosomal protein L34